MQRRRKWVVASLSAAAVLAAGSGLAAATFLEEDDTPITGEALERASEAALDHTGGGRVTDTEVGDEDAYYEVEVTLPDGRKVDVHLDEEFRVVGSAPDIEDDGED